MGKITKQDPTGQARTRLKATRALESQVRQAKAEILILFRGIPRTVKSVKKITNAKSTQVYDYQITEQQFEQLDQSARNAISNIFLETIGESMPYGWTYKKYVELAHRQGTVEETRDFNELVAAAALAGLRIGGIAPREVSVESVLLSDRYTKRLVTAEVTSYQNIKTMSQRTASQVVQTINSGVQAGRSPGYIAKEISKRFKVAETSARRIAETTINEAYTNAKMAMSLDLAESTGLRTAVMHISALMATTREHHAARHGNVYSVADQTQWWGEGANRINCHCTVNTVLVNSSGKVVNRELQKEIKAERAFFDS
jgi:SPP1 gp7 family putative phage head morphogenesis protein